MRQPIEGARRRALVALADSIEMDVVWTVGSITFGLAALMYFTLMGFRPSLNLIIAGHLVVTMPFILRTTTASLSQLDPALLTAAEPGRVDGDSWLESQEHAPASLDVLVAAHVLSAARDVDAALRRVRALLRPGGALVVIETTEPTRRWDQLVLGLTPEWWRFDGTDGAVAWQQTVAGLVYQNGIAFDPVSGLLVVVGVANDDYPDAEEYAHVWKIDPASGAIISHFYLTKPVRVYGVDVHPTTGKILIVTDYATTP